MKTIKGALLIAMLTAGTALAQPAWAQSATVNPSLAEARAQALQQPRTPTQNTDMPRQCGFADGGNASAAVPGSGTGPKFFGEVRRIQGEGAASTGNADLGGGSVGSK